MTILIKGMEMPEGCWDCELGGVYTYRDANDVCIEEKYRCSVTFCPVKDLAKRHEKCPLIEVPTHHGRLIDADAIPFVQSEDGCTDDYAYRYDINELPTVIEAEEDKT